ncbi:MAG: Holliday junction branch migration DNA helicase RuvB [Firmicutes bacterium]|nr:Holliday junction branch migration DNA helicase RuvB [Bacillota bacterium]
MEEQFFTSTLTDKERDTENILRPKTFPDYVGQEKVKENLSVYIKAALSRGESLDHVLLYGPPGLGKTTLAHIIANEMGVPITITSGSAVPSKFDLSAILSKLKPGEVLFIDEIHRLSSSLEEILYPAMEDYRLDFVVGKGPSATSVNIKLEKFTLIGATTKAGNLAAPLRDRFGMQMRLVLYTPEQLKEIVVKSAKKLGAEIESSAAYEIARRSRGTPRIANRLLKRVRDFAEVLGDGVITKDVTTHAMKVMEVDEQGLDAVDKNILNTIIDKFSGGPVGLDTIASATGEDAATIEDVYEPYLMQLGFIARTPRGRVCMPNAYKHLGKKISKERLEALSIYIDEEDKDENK